MEDQKAIEAALERILIAAEGSEKIEAGRYFTIREAVRDIRMTINAPQTKGNQS